MIDLSFETMNNDRETWAAQTGMGTSKNLSRPGKASCPGEV